MTATHSPELFDTDAVIRTATAILVQNDPSQLPLATDLLRWTAEASLPSKDVPCWLNGDEEKRQLSADSLCQHTAPEDRRTMAKALASPLRWVVSRGNTPPGHAGETLRSKVTQHLEIITQEATAWPTPAAPAWA